MAAAGSELPDMKQEQVKEITESSQPASSLPASQLQVVVWRPPAAAVTPLRQINQASAVAPPAKKVKNMAKKKFELPSGWTFKVTTREGGDSIGKKDKFYFDPKGKRYRSLKEVKRALRLL